MNPSHCEPRLPVKPGGGRGRPPSEIQATMIARGATSAHQGVADATSPGTAASNGPDPSTRAICQGVRIQDGAHSITYGAGLSGDRRHDLLPLGFGRHETCPHEKRRSCSRPRSWSFWRRYRIPGSSARGLIHWRTS